MPKFKAIINGHKYRITQLDFSGLRFQISNGKWIYCKNIGNGEFIMKSEEYEIVI